MKSESESCSVMSDSLQPHGLHTPWNFPGQNTGVGTRSLLQGILPIQWLNPGLPHCRQILYQLSYQGRPRTLEWVAYPFSGGSSWPRNRTRVSCTAGGFSTSWATRKARLMLPAVKNYYRATRSPGGGNCIPLQYSSLENSMDGGAWWAIVRRVTKS